MKNRRELLWLSASTAALLIFSFTAGFGLRELYALASGKTGSSLASSPRALARYLQIASRNGAAAAGEPDMGPPQLYAEVLDRLRTLYVDKLPDNTTLSYSSIEQMLASLYDPNARLLMPAEATALKAAEEGSFSGLGAVLAVRRPAPAEKNSTEREITVVAPLPGSPAEAAHLLPGDKITEVDGHWIAPIHLWQREMAFATDRIGRADSQWQRDRDAGPDPDDEKPQATPEQRKQAQEAADKIADRWRNSTDVQAAMELLETQTTGEHTLTIERPGEPKPRQVKVTFGSFKVAPVSKRLLPGNIGHIQVRQISADTVPALEAALKELHDGGAQSLVLDLRHSPGGSLEAVQQIAGLFLPSGPMGTLQVRDEKRKLVDRALAVKPATAPAPKFNAMAVLVDGGTAGSSEVLAAALHDQGVAKLYGSTTFGDGLEQTILPLDNGAAVCITSGKFLTPKRIDFDGKGLKPDFAIPAGPGLDKPLEQAVKALRA
jgi:carboxyl-terminal processing protease